MKKANYGRHYVLYLEAVLNSWVSFRFHCKGDTPDDWKEAQVRIPIYKNSDLSSPADYRPTLCKTLEHVKFLSTALIWI